jgi:hypothetical protein
MNFRYLLLFLLLGSIAFADTDCNTSYTDDLKIRVLDAKSRPVDGASVLVYHQYSGTFGVAGLGTYHTIGPKTTNSSGIVNVTIKNTEQTEDKLDCNIKINASIGDAANQTTVIANAHPDFVDVGLNVYPLVIYVRDQSAVPLEGSAITIDGLTKKADSNGYVKYYAKPGTVDYLVSYLTGKQSGSIMISDDVTYGINLAFYPITIDLIDDNGNPLNGSVMIFNKTYETVSGSVTLNKTFGDEIDFSAIYKGLIKDQTMYPAISKKKQVVFDLNAPTIGSVSKEEIDKKVRLTIPVEDKGIYPSGINTSTISITYRLESEGATAWEKATTYVSSKDVFIADFPEFKPNSLVQFRIEVNDNEGNKATVTGRFTTSVTQPPTTDTNSQQKPPEGEDFPLLPVIGGILIVAFVLYMFFRFGKKGGENQQV